jgi:Bacterial pre-peptidase C-terminal domain
MCRPKWLFFVLSLCSLCLCGEVFFARAEDKKDGPKVLVAVPLGVAPGATTKVTVRGLKLDGATEVKFTDAGVTAKVVSKGKATVPNMQEPARVGDTQVEVEVTLPKEFKEAKAEFAVVTPDGETKPHALLVETTLPVVAEKEPNNGFRQAQPLPLPGAVDGMIAQPQDVDTYRIEGKAGQQLVAEVLAARLGSALDSFLTLYDADGQQLASNDDDAGTDSRIEFTLPKDGVYYLSLLDAHDLGGPAHVYRLVVKTAAPPK